MASSRLSILENAVTRLGYTDAAASAWSYVNDQLVAPTCWDAGRTKPAFILTKPMHVCLYGNAVTATAMSRKKGTLYARTLEKSCARRNFVIPRTPVSSLAALHENPALTTTSSARTGSLAAHAQRTTACAPSRSSASHASHWSILGMY